MQAGMIGFITLQQSAPSQMTGRHDWLYYTSTKCAIPDDMQIWDYDRGSSLHVEWLEIRVESGRQSRTHCVSYVIDVTEKSTHTHTHIHTEFRVDDDVSSNFEAPACADYGMCTDSEIESFIYVSLFW